MKKISEKRKERIRYLRKKGYGVPKISKKTGISEPTVYNVIIRSNLPLRIKRKVKLSKVNKTFTRVVCLSAELIRETGFKPERELFGEWKIKDKNLILKLGYKNG